MSNTFSTKQGILCSIETWHVRNFYQMSRCFALIIVTCNIFLLSNLWEMEYIHLNLFLWRPQITVLTVWLWVMALCLWFCLNLSINCYPPIYFTLSSANMQTNVTLSILVLPYMIIDLFEKSFAALSDSLKLSVRRHMSSGFNSLMCFKVWSTNYTKMFDWF